MRIRWLPRGKASVDAQLNYIALRNPFAAVAVGDRIRGAVEQLRDHPLSGRAGRVEGTRELVVSGSPYIIVYSVDNDAVLILRVLHGKQRWVARRKE